MAHDKDKEPIQTGQYVPRMADIKDLLTLHKALGVLIVFLDEFMAPDIPATSDASFAYIQLAQQIEETLKRKKIPRWCRVVYERPYGTLIEAQQQMYTWPLKRPLLAKLRAEVQRAAAEPPDSLRNKELAENPFVLGSTQEEMLHILKKNYNEPGYKLKRRVPDFDEKTGNFYFDADKPPCNFIPNRRPHRIIKALWDKRPESVSPQEVKLTNKDFKDDVWRVKEKLNDYGYDAPIKPAGNYRYYLDIPKPTRLKPINQKLKETT